MQWIEVNDWLQVCLVDVCCDVECVGVVLCVQFSILLWVDVELCLLQLVLSNLVGNVLCYVCLQVDVLLVGVGGCVCLCVDDDGFGIVEVDCEKVVCLFICLDDSCSCDIGGFGFGLVIVGCIVVCYYGELCIGCVVFGGVCLEMYWLLVVS